MSHIFFEIILKFEIVRKTTLGLFNSRFISPCDNVIVYNRIAPKRKNNVTKDPVCNHLLKYSGKAWVSLDGGEWRGREGR